MISLNQYVILNEFFDYLCWEYASFKNDIIYEKHSIFPNCEKISNLLVDKIIENLRKKIYSFDFTTEDCKELFVDKIEIQLLPSRDYLKAEMGFGSNNAKDKDIAKVLIKPKFIRVLVNSYNKFTKEKLQSLLSHELTHFYTYKILYDENIDIKKLIENSGYLKYSSNFKFDPKNINDILYFSDKNESQAYLSQANSLLTSSKFNTPQEAFAEIMKLPLFAMFIKIKDTIDKLEKNFYFIEYCRNNIKTCEKMSDGEIWKWLKHRVNKSYEYFRKTLAKLCYDKFLNENLIIK